jgi:hypothetical protein
LLCYSFIGAYVEKCEELQQSAKAFLDKLDGEFSEFNSFTVTPIHSPKASLSPVATARGPVSPSATPKGSVTPNGPLSRSPSRSPSRSRGSVYQEQCLAELVTESQLNGKLYAQFKWVFLGSQHTKDNYSLKLLGILRG